MVRCVGAIHAAYFLIIVSEKALGGASGKHDIGKCAALIIQRAVHFRTPRNRLPCVSEVQSNGHERKRCED